jgi:vacuolar-type H+-ATPase subunit H
MNDGAKKKIFIMRVMVGSVFFVVLILWAFNLKNVWRDNVDADKTAAEWTGLKQELSETLSDAQTRLDQLKEEQAAADKKAGDKLLSGILEDAAKNASSSSLVAGTTSSPIMATSTAAAVGSNCPKYIDCMPTIGEDKACVVPLGCEGITIIAY